jgi:2-methylisocitrate lyase-like PEP mutase family enzyme
LEDQIFPKKCAHYPGKSLISMEEMVGKLHAAVDTRTDEDFIIIARTDAATSMGVEEAIRRSCAYIDAGADIIFIILHRNPHMIEQLKTVCSSLSKPTMLDLSLSSSHVPPVPELVPTGLKIGLITTAITYTAITAMRQAAREMKKSGLAGVMSVLERTDPRDSILELWDLNGTMALSEKYSEQAFTGKKSC